MVYFIFSPDDPRSLVKIGFTAQPVEDRIEQLQTGNPFRLCLIMTLDGGKALEQRLHRRFHKSHCHGEWFYPTDDLRQFIRDAMGEPFNATLAAMAADDSQVAWLASVLGWAECEVRAGLAAAV